MKKLPGIIIGILVVVLLLSMGKDMIIKAAVESGTQMVTGLKLSMQSFQVGAMKSLVGIKGLTLFNPKGYLDKVMLDMPEIYVKYNLPDIIKGTIHLEDMRINLKEFTVVKNEKGELNLNSLKVVKEQKEGKKQQEKGKVPPMKIDNLELKIGKVIYKDYSKGGAPSVREFNVNINEKYSNITNPNALVALIMVKALTNTTISSLTNFDLKGLQGTVSDTLAKAEKIAAGAAVEAEKMVTQATAKTTQAVEKTTETVKKTAEGLTEVLKFPFGTQEKQK